MSVQGVTLPKLPDFLSLVPEVKAGEDIGKYVRLAMVAAMLSVCFEQLTGYWLPENFNWFYSIVLPLGAAITLTAVLNEKYSRIAVAVFSAVFLYDFSIEWVGAANHGWLAVWTITGAVLVE